MTALRTLFTSRQAKLLAVLLAAVGMVALLNRVGGSHTAQTIPVAPASSAQAPETLTWSPTTGPVPGAPSTRPGPQPAANDTPTPDGSTDVGDDVGDAGTNPARAATITAGPTDPREAALALLAALLNTYNKTPQQWRAGFADTITPQLRDLYANVDPSAVPNVATLATPVVATIVGDAVVDVRVPTSGGGTFTVTMVGGSHRWLGSQIDYARPS
jgi:hypothetical protein